jgi:hypothetical protein
MIVLRAKSINAESGAVSSDTTELVFPEKITLKGDNSQYASRFNDYDVKFGKSEQDQYCIFIVKEQPDNKIALQADNHKYLTRWGDYAIEARKGSIDKYCQFEVFYIGGTSGNTIALKGDNGKFLSLYDNNSYLEARKDTMDKFCQFEVVEPIISKSIENVQYDLDNATTSELSPVVSTSTNVVNNSQVSETDQEIAYSYTKCVEGTWNNSVGTELGYSVSFTAGMPFLSTTMEYSMSVSSSHEWGGSESVTTQISESTTVKVPAGGSSHVDVLIQQAKMTVPFTYDEVRTYISGDTNTITLNGIYENLESYRVDVKTTDIH